MSEAVAVWYLMSLTNGMNIKYTYYVYPCIAVLSGKHFLPFGVDGMTIFVVQWLMSNDYIICAHIQWSAKLP